MNFQVFYEDRHGNVVDKYGRSKSMDYIIDEEQYALETVGSYAQYLHSQPQEDSSDVDSMEDEDAKDDIDVCMKEASSKRAYALYTDQGKVRFFKLVFEKVMSASAAAKQLDIHHKKTGRSCILHEEHKQVILKYIDENPSAVLEQVMERLLQKFQDLKVSKSTVYNFVRTECNLLFKKAQFQPERTDWVRKWECADMGFRTNCVFLNESAFHINLKRSMVWSKKGLPAVATVPKTRAQTTTILGAISASELIKCSLRLPQTPAKQHRIHGRL
ncbi:hypothetical protein BCV72DRAFT_324531 [Rhizopus microsporus var. microsporus]|uniref:Tc1-like transposase DDE domain-containing protein n=1 Tax=Rhizopus microsporus var. microsporus TaxID=86635 RepID=A0A1X0RHN7_RHIZD|nr:hypothetical protein BCV72DRAFT_324531 [Rhizopus microsporus var. microsporus]